MLWRDNEGKNQITEAAASEINKDVSVSETDKDAVKEQISMYLNGDGQDSYQQRVEMLKKQVEELKRQKAEIEKRKRQEETDRKIEAARRRAEARKNAAIEANKREFASKAEKRRLLLEKERDAEKRRKLIAAAKNKKRQERQQLINQQRELQRQLRAESKAEENRLRQQLAELKRSEKSELRRQRHLAEKSAELGGGIVNVHGTTVSTEIRPVVKLSIRDLLGFGAKKARREAVTRKEKKAAQELRNQRKEQARQIAAQISALQWERRWNTPFGKKVQEILAYCDKNKKPLLVGFSAVLTLLIVTAGIFNYYTVFEYSYNGKALGYVKDREDVIKVTELVQNALSQDTNAVVKVDAKKDISFKRILTLGHEYTQDSTDMVLKRLTYVGDLNVEAFGIFVDGKKIGAVQSKEVAANVLQGIEDRYASKKKGSKIEEAVIVEDVKVKKSDTSLHNVMNEEEMIEELCRDRVKETVHTVAAGETLEDIAKSYNMDVESLKESNENVDPDNLETGSVIVIKETAPALTVRLTEVRTYDKTVKYETKKVKDKEIYKGYSEVRQEGKNGKSTLTDRTQTVNGELVETENLETIVKKKPVEKIIHVGAKKRPPTVGCGKLIWPADKSSFTVTSEFKWRWGRQHQGMDLGCHVGTDVLAADGGTVTYSGYMGGYGYLIIIDHQNGMETYYGHNSSLIAKTGDKVFQGQHIAESGNTGRSTGPHIHLGVKVNGSFVNPREYLPD